MSDIDIADNVHFFMLKPFHANTFFAKDLKTYQIFNQFSFPSTTQLLEITLNHTTLYCTCLELIFKYLCNLKINIDNKVLKITIEIKNDLLYIINISKNKFIIQNEIGK